MNETSNHTYEMRIKSNGKLRVFRFSEAMLWEDLYNSCALVNNDNEPDQDEVDGILIGSISVATDWDEIVRIIEEDAGLCGASTINALKTGADDCYVV